jgi:hypothetical protein
MVLKEYVIYVTTFLYVAFGILRVLNKLKVVLKLFFCGQYASYIRDCILLARCAKSR